MQGCALPRALDPAPAGNYFGLIIAPRPEKELLFWLSIKQRNCYHATPNTTQLFLEAPEAPVPATLPLPSCYPNYLKCAVQEPSQQALLKQGLAGKGRRLCKQGTGFPGNSCK